MYYIADNIVTKHKFLIWRIKHPTHRQCTFYSPPHILYSRLDHFFITSPLLSTTATAEINPIRTCHWVIRDIMLA